MRSLLFLLVPAALFAGPPRFARLGEFEGKVEAQLAASEPWIGALRNLPLPEAAWVRTDGNSRVEMELDDGSAWRLGPDSLGELSDYTRLSTGQRVTLLSLDHGLAYFSGEPQGQDALTLAIPGAQVILHRGARVRLEAQDAWSQISVLEGAIRFSSPAAEMELREGQTVKVEPANPSRFFLYREVTKMDLDRWNTDRDKALAAPSAARHVSERYGLADLDASGQWIQTDEWGAVWKPKTAEDWIPYREGRWFWYDALGYTWIAGDSWGWLPYHYGRWLHQDGLGWVWAPSKNEVFKPGEVYWLVGTKFAGWGPVAPGEEWAPSTQPRQFLNANTTYAAFRQDARVIDPDGFKDRPKEPLGAAAFALALPSPAFAPARLEAVRPVLRAGSTRVVPVLTGVTYQEGALPKPVMSKAAPPAEPLPATPADSAVAVVTNAGAVQAPMVVVTQPAVEVPAPPAEVYYPAPVYTSVIVVNPPERDTTPPKRRRDPPPPAPAQPAPKPAPPAAEPVAAKPPVRHEPPPDAPPAKPLPERPVAKTSPERSSQP